MNLSNFEKYRSTKHDIFVSWGKAYFNFNSAAIKKYNLSNFSYCFLYYDKTSNQVAFEFLKKEEEGSVKISKRAQIRIESSDFMKYYKIPWSKVTRLSIIKKNHLFIVQL